jgi:hypothetical protein
MRTVEEHNQWLRDWRKTLVGKASAAYYAMQQRVRGQVHRSNHAGLNIVSMPEFLDWATADQEYIRLYDAWVTSGYVFSLTPSIDRIDVDIGYEIGNMRWLTQSENARRGAKESRPWLLRHVKEVV